MCQASRKPSVPCDHIVQLYEDDGFLCDTLAEYVQAGLEAGEPLVVVATPSHWEGTRERLRAGAFDVERASSAGLLRLFDARETLAALLVDGLPDEGRFRAIVGGVFDSIARVRSPSRVRAFGEMVDLLWRAGNRRAALRLEELWNDLGRDYSFSLLCAYAMASLGGEDHEGHFAEMCAAHGHVVPAESYARLTTQDARLRRIGLLQRRARALEIEVDRRVQLEHERARLLEQEIEQRRRVELLQSITASLAGALDPRDVARVIMDEGTAAIGAPSGGVWILAEDASTLELAHSVGFQADERERWARVALDASAPVARCVAERREVWIESRAAWKEAYPVTAATSTRRTEVAFFCLPLVVDGRALGAFSMSFGEARAFPEHDRRFFATIARHCAQALDRARLFDAERRARAEAEAMNRLKDEFLATVSHELRSPLTAILGWAALMRTRRDMDLGKAIETIERNARLQARLIEDVLDVSRIVTGKLELDLAPIDLTAVLRAALEIVTPAAIAKGVTLGARLAPGPLPFYGDADRLQQVIWNLLSNAVKFTPREGRVEVRLVRAGLAVELTVHDTGNGIRAEFLPHVFERFRQADSSKGRVAGGLGLGLALVRHLVELHGGAVKAESPGEGCGSTFTVTLPVRAKGAAAREAPRPPRLPELSPVAATGSLAGVRVVVCDDEPDVRALVHEVLAAAGASVRVACSCAEALSLIGDAPPSVLVSDIGMPYCDGYALIRHVRALPHHQGGGTPAIALTAYTRGADVSDALSAGYQLHLAKPVDPGELVRMVANLASSCS
jgi:signal transduction histidine kinase